MKNLFAENRLVFMGIDKAPPAGGLEKIASLSELPKTEEVSYQFAKKFIKVDETGASPDELVKFIKKSSSRRSKLINAWIKGYAKKEKLDSKDSKTLKVLNKLAGKMKIFFNFRKNRKLRTHVRTFLKRANDENKESAKEIAEMTRRVRIFSDRLTNAMKVVVDSHSVQSVGKSSNSNNRASVVKKYVGTFKKALRGTGVVLKEASAKKIQVDVPDVVQTAKIIKQKSRRDKIVASIMKHKKPERLASR
jgi:hypothetical protein